MKRNETPVPAVIVAGTNSGCGKTTVSLGIMAALKMRGMDVQPFKCGPDFIDPTLHRLITGNISRNLDIRMCGEEFVRHTFARHGSGADISVVEGVMGLFDGGQGSAATLAKALEIPVILVVNAASAAESAAAVIKGFEELDREIQIAGVILNNVAGPRHEELIRDAVDQHCRTEIVGVLPRDPDFAIPERHLGLFMGEEAPLGPEGITSLVEVMERCVDLDAVCRCRSGLKPFPSIPVRVIKGGRKTRIAVARDRAFSFYYEDNLDMLKDAGAELVEFSVLEGSRLPDDIQGVYIGGGYPELHAEAISKNRSMLESLRSWATNGGVMLAECGGFMLLSEGITLDNGKFHGMAGVFPVKVCMNRRLRRLGYRKVVFSRDSLLGKAGDTLYGHEFHYSDITDMSLDLPQVFEHGDIQGWQTGNTLGGYMHFHFGRTPGAVLHFVKGCMAEETK